ncbi:MAG: hypothetical protein E6265_21445 [Enterobacteriaceae bacterium]|nr:hypothetical protein [Enterobacteriaceae bacterium]
MKLGELPVALRLPGLPDRSPGQALAPPSGATPRHKSVILENQF